MDPDVSVDELTGPDVPDVTGLCRLALDLPEDAAEASWIVDRLLDPGEPAGVRRTVGFVARHGSSVTGVVLGSMSARHPATGHVDLIAVAPQRRRQGVGRALLGRMEGALAGLGARTVRLAGNPPHYGWPGIDVRYTPAVCAALALGYRQDQTAWNMTVRLAGPGGGPVLDTRDDERRLAAAGIEVRAAGPADLPALTEFARSTFGGAWDAEITGSVRQPTGGCHVALRDGRLLGFAAYGSSRPSWFGPMGTAPAAGGSGIGRVLLRRCLADQRAAGHDRVQIGWVGPVPFYARSVDARIERVFVLYAKDVQG
jgi:predicted N-acetyltransferase YhbS